MYDLPDPLQILTDPPTKSHFKKLTRKKILDHWHRRIVTEVKSKSSLKFLRPEFLPLGMGPHPIWTSCGDSPTATRSATIVCQILSGRYRDDYLSSKWSDNPGNCSNCGQYPGNVTHYLSGNCPALSTSLMNTLEHSLSSLPLFPDFASIVHCALSRSSFEWTKFVLDPTTDPQVINIKQNYGVTSIWPLLKLCRGYVWTMHRQRMRLSDSVTS